MKKIICILISLMVFGTASFAQNKTDKAPAKKAAAPAAKDTTTTVATPAKPAAKTKKDGTPDNRFKENKAAAKPAGPLKKDGTPDKRYKANKTNSAAAPKAK